MTHTLPRKSKHIVLTNTLPTMITRKHIISLSKPIYHFLIFGGALTFPLGT